jgi:hypothetical protein
MKLMVACTVLTWIEVDTDSKEVGPARVHNLPENLTIPKDTKVHNVLAIDPERDSQITVHQASAAIRLVRDHEGPLTFRLEE